LGVEGGSEWRSTRGREKRQRADFGPAEVPYLLDEEGIGRAYGKEEV
jgi:hypothetical protein